VSGSATAAWPGIEPVAERASILIVDDLPEKLLVFRTVLEELDQNLVCVRSGQEALREVLQQEFAVILLDVNMPDIDGFETAALIRQYKRAAHTPIIFITSYADEMQTAHGYSLGAVDYILSPVVPPVLRSKVQVFVRLFNMQRQIKRQADAEAAFIAAEAARRVAEENDRRSAFLSNASRLLHRSLDCDVVLRELGALMVPALAPIVVLTPEEGDADADAVLVVSARHGDESLVRSVPRSDLAPALRALLVSAQDERARVGLPTEAVAALDITALGLEARTMASLSAAAWPFVNGDRTLGGMLILGGVGGAQPDWRLMDALAERAGPALENAKLYRSVEREVDERIAAEARLQEASRRKDEFLAMLSHELRNPLAPIMTALEVIRRIAPVDPKFTWATDIMRRQLRQMTRLIEELLDVARISQGKIVLAREKVDLNAVLAQSLESAQPFLDARHQTVNVAMPAQPMWLLGDFARLAQIVSNLLNNAAKYSDKGTVIELSADNHDGEAVIAVRDQGIGIDDQLLPRVFELFTQGHRGLDRSQGGLGVGLTLARRLAEMHGGRLDAHSEGIGKGSTFTLRLPCVGLVRGQDVAADRAPALLPRRCRILVVDDNRDAALSIGKFLELEGHSVRTAADGAKALEVAAVFAPEVVVLDIGLPVLDGYEVARRLRKMPALQQVLLIALTGYGQKDDRLAADAAGFDQHFVKPIDPELLLACIAQWLQLPTEARRLPASVP
jgi:signal transduction histidine kinase/DNA-binding response OmpR family regulator